jgi:hypothetical protein
VERVTENIAKFIGDEKDLAASGELNVCWLLGQFSCEFNQSIFVGRMLSTTSMRTSNSGVSVHPAATPSVSYHPRLWRGIRVKY